MHSEVHVGLPFLVIDPGGDDDGDGDFCERYHDQSIITCTQDRCSDYDYLYSR